MTIETHIPAVANPQDTCDAWGERTARRAIEDDTFPFEYLSQAAAAESWRKEINRPIYHLHKWWAQRLGSVFRGLVLGAALPAGTSVRDAFASATRLPGLVVFDPFMGSGTTVGETLKLGARAIGRDINPVAVRTVRAALGLQCPQDIADAFLALEQMHVADRVRSLYQVEVDGAAAEVLYFFWVMAVPCPFCASAQDLFSSRIFARHAYASRFPAAQAVCPRCGGVNSCRADARTVRCTRCGDGFSTAGAVEGASAVCAACHDRFRVVDALDAAGRPPDYRLYAKLILMPDGSKRYVAVDETDHQAFEAAKQRLSERPNPFPVVAIDQGYNTRQILRYHFTQWHELFNPRQLLALSLLAEGIQQLPANTARAMLHVLFSGTLEFNNMFASYKGEGTGAVRHMFSHHILKPERMPIEANLWGTPRSSGSFSGLFKSRVLRSLAYAAAPFELVPTKVGTTERVSGLSEPVGHQSVAGWGAFAHGARLYLSCGDSRETDLPTGSVDLVVTDPPFFDNVHYSELADFFHVWQRHITGDTDLPATTRTRGEVQHTNASEFARRLGGVFREARRTLRNDGLLVFTYHHSRSEGWAALLQALVDGGFVVVATHPVKSEMAVAAPKARAHQPIDIDLIAVCRKAEHLSADPLPSREALWQRAMQQVERMRAASHAMGPGDQRVVYLGALLPLLTRLPVKQASDALNAASVEVEALLTAGAFAA